MARPALTTDPACLRCKGKGHAVKRIGWGPNSVLVRGVCQCVQPEVLEAGASVKRYRELLQWVGDRTAELEATWGARAQNCENADVRKTLKDCRRALRKIRSQLADATDVAGD